MSASIEEILGGLSKKTRQWVKVAQDAELLRVETPSLGLNQAIGGGLGRGRITTFWGNKSAGKSTLCLQTIALAQQQGLTCAYLDSEKTFDKEWAARLGVDNSKLFLANTGSFAAMNDTAVELIKAGIGVLVVDSITNLLPGSFFEKDSEEVKGLDGTKQIGSSARDLGNALKMMNYVNEETAIILISQIRNKFLQQGAMHQHTGGLAVEHASSTIIKLQSSAREADQLTGSVTVGDKIFEEPVARKVSWEVQKNKVGKTFGTGEYYLYYAGEFIGVDSLGEVLDLADAFGIIKKGGSWYTIYNERIQGKVAAAEYLRSHPEVVDKIKAELSERI